MKIPFVLLVLLVILATEAIIFCGIGIINFICMVIEDIKYMPHPHRKK